MVMLKEEIKKEAKRHWEYVEKILELCLSDVSGDHSLIIKTIEFHYITAFIHGWGHGARDQEKEYKVDPANVKLGPKSYDEEFKHKIDFKINPVCHRPNLKMDSTKYEEGKGHD